MVLKKCDRCATVFMLDAAGRDVAHQRADICGIAYVSPYNGVALPCRGTLIEFTLASREPE